MGLMSTSITHSFGSITPEVVDGYTASREARTVVHPILNRSDPDITLRATGLRTGSLSCVFKDQASAITAYGILSVAQVLTLTDPEVPAVDMSFVVAEGDLEIALDDETREVWIVTVPFVEVSP